MEQVLRKTKSEGRDAGGTRGFVSNWTFSEAYGARQKKKVKRDGILKIIFFSSDEKRPSCLRTSQNPRDHSYTLREISSRR